MIPLTGNKRIVWINQVWYCINEDGASNKLDTFTAWPSRSWPLFMFWCGCQLMSTKYHKVPRRWSSLTETSSTQRSENPRLWFLRVVFFEVCIFVIRIHYFIPRRQSCSFYSFTFSRFDLGRGYFHCTVKITQKVIFTVQWK